MLCYAVLSSVFFWIMSFHGMLGHAMLNQVMWYCAAPYHAILAHAISCHVIMLCYDMVCQEVKMIPHVRMILCTVCLFASGIASVIGLTLGYHHAYLLGAYPADQPQDLQRARRYVDGLPEFRSKDDLPGVVDFRTGPPTFVSKYLNYTNATITTDTSICSSRGMYVT